MVITAAHLPALVALIAGILILLMPRLLNFIVAIYLIFIGLVGLDTDNSHALERAIVMHPAWYVDATMISKWGKIGRSEGCFAMAPEDFNEALLHLSGGRLLFADRIGEA